MAGPVEYQLNVQDPSDEAGMGSIHRINVVDDG